MKIEAIKIYGFGKWVNQEFTLPEMMTVFYGENEAGKSTLMAFINGMLFGFASKKSKFINTYEPKQQAVYGGEIQFLHHNKKYRLIRRYRTNSEIELINLQTNENYPNPQPILDDILGPITSETFQQIYAINADELAEVRSLTPNELEQRLLKIGAVGAIGWLQVADKFEKEAQVLFAANSKNGKRPLNGLLNEYRRTVDNQLEIQRQLPTYFASLESLQSQHVAIDNLKAEIKKRQATLVELNELARLEPLYQQMRKLERKQAQQVQQINEETKVRFEQLQFQKTNLIEEITHLEQEMHTSDISSVYGQEFEQQVTKLQPRLGMLMEMAANYRAMEQQVNQLSGQYQTALNKFNELNSASQLQRVTPPTKQNKSVKWTIGAIVAGIVILLFLPFTIIIKFIIAIIVMAIIWIIGQQTSSIEITNDEKIPMANIQVAQSQLLQVQQQLQASQQQLQKLVQAINREQQGINNLKLENVQNSVIASDFPRQLQQINQLLNEYMAEQQANALGKADQVYQEQYYKQRQQQLANVRREMQTVLNSVGLIDESEFHLQLVKQNVDAQQNQELRAMQKQFTELQIKRLASLTTPVTDLIASTNMQLTQDKVQMEALESQLKTSQIQHLKVVSNGTLNEVEQQVANLQHDFLSGLEDFMVKQLTSQWINEALKQSSQQRMPQIILLATKYFQMLTGGHFVAIKMESNMISLVTSTEENFTLAELSKGTSEQLYVAFRIAFAQVLADLIEFPIIIDDGFVNFDAQRLERMHGLMLDLSTKQQVIYFTSNPTVLTDFTELQIVTL
ncbi:ATP-binding protein [Periweissella fabalis]|uniref:AAA family ATPase n=1 Tax=Periweissella fabalis TaxID=1070421 RepID=A0A7X6N5Q7_9LACO|nr:AAA family ATPase [Periweissella fabalis]MCM0598826.1 AAA family ATPase [Periweissella fabalis]NKZ24488.1 AAA family ATPase [Periweissella fabalis]